MQLPQRMAGIPELRILAGKQSLEGQRWAGYPCYGILAWERGDPPLLRPSPPRCSPMQVTHLPRTQVEKPPPPRLKGLAADKQGFNKGRKKSRHILVADAEG